MSRYEVKCPYSHSEFMKLPLEKREEWYEERDRMRSKLRDDDAYNRELREKKSKEMSQRFHESLCCCELSHEIDHPSSLDAEDGRISDQQESWVNGGFFLDYSFEEDHLININYCPFCGTDLKKLDFSKVK